MKQTNALKEFLILALLLLPMAYLAIIWNNLPVDIPTSFDKSGNPEGMNGRTAFLLLMIFQFVTNALIYALFRYIPPEESNSPVVSTIEQREYYRVRFAIHIYLALFSCLIIFMVSLGKPFEMARWAFVVIGVLVIGIGLYLRKLQTTPNHYIGVRTPWTLQSSEIWTKTHQMAATLWISAGVVMIIISFFLPLITGVFLIFFAAIVLAALPYIYSFRLYNKDKG
ncbi:SdpI family protein [Chitinophaga sp. HK235]|uniref:SdpI family protein n=1 Tax=Chitinophaga sp. HK235 TaxID=2952571 RepID=UPI001BA4D95D|nr:SdpI family protein [Chitinophaga sp. HK235]